jgi:dimethylhistidine N-methyltransferase
MGPNRSRLSFHDLRPDAVSLRAEVLAGLARPQKQIPPKFLYDERGSELFEAICELPEYYPTRTEIALMQDRVGEMVAHLGRGCVLIEYGSGSGRKTRILIGALEPVAYVPIDIARAQLEAASVTLAKEFPGLAIIAVCADYSRALALPELDALGVRRRVVYFPGSTIGNFTVPEAAAFLDHVKRTVGPGGGLLVGVDVRKDPARLIAAYDDASGVTAEFNLNLLTRINRELGGDFDLCAFRHRVVYNEAMGRIEMHLESLKAQEVRLAGRAFRFRPGETIHTENSYKYSPDEFRGLARASGFEPVECWSDAGALFSVHYLAVPG